MGNGEMGNGKVDRHRQMLSLLIGQMPVQSPNLSEHCGTNNSCTLMH